MKLTTIKKKGLRKFGKYHYSLAASDIKSERDDFLFLFKGYIYPDIDLTTDDLFDYLKDNMRNPDLKIFKGRYCGCVIDKKKDTVRIFNDQLGLNSLYYHFSDEQLIICDDFRSVLEIKRFSLEDLDRTALAEFMMYEHVLSDRTFIRSIKSLTYASAILFDLKNHTKISNNYWRYIHHPEPIFNKKRALEKFDHLLRQAMSRAKQLYPEKAFAIGVSGGMDSRLVAKYALDAGIKLEPFVIGNAGCDAFTITDDIARILGIKLRKLVVKKDFWRYLNQHISYDPMMNILYLPYYTIRDRLPKTDCILTGFNGDNMLGGHIRKTDFSHDITTVEKINRRYKLDVVEGIIPYDILPSVNEDLDAYAKLRVPDWQKCEIFNFENRQMRFVKNSTFFTFYGKYKDDFSIFSDIDVVNFALQLPLDELKDSRFYYDFFKIRLPLLAKIRAERKPYAVCDPPIIKKLKGKLLSAKFHILKKTGMMLPIFRSIQYTGMLDWDKMTLETKLLEEFDKSRGALMKNRAEKNDIKKTCADYLHSLRSIYHYMTIVYFIEAYLKK